MALPSSDYESSALPEGAIEDFEAQLDAIVEGGSPAESPDEVEEILDAEVVEEPEPSLEAEAAEEVLQAPEAVEAPDSEVDE